MPHDIRRNLDDATPWNIEAASYVEPARVPRLVAGEVLHLAELVPILRRRLDIDGTVSNEAMLACLTAIARHSSTRERWRAAFDSRLGHWLAEQGRDLNTALNTLVALLPKPRL